MRTCTRLPAKRSSSALVPLCVACCLFLAVLPAAHAMPSGVLPGFPTNSREEGYLPLLLRRAVEIAVDGTEDTPSAVAERGDKPGMPRPTPSAKRMRAVTVRTMSELRQEADFLAELAESKPIVGGAKGKHGLGEKPSAEALLSWDMMRLARLAAIMGASTTDHTEENFKQKVLLSIVGTDIESETLEDAAKKAAAALLEKIGGAFDADKLHKYLADPTIVDVLLSNLHVTFGAEIPVLTAQEKSIPEKKKSGPPEIFPRDNRFPRTPVPRPPQQEL
ncbi:hypothetical protein Pelo_12460 [Pelomyxa schiedti]|nr:hypothetical protein Pelo_12460 [Pelomyxa schiedti]